MILNRRKGIYDGIVDSIIVLMIATVVGMAFEFMRRKIGIEKLKTIKEELAIKQDLVLIAVKYVEQAWYDLDGPGKYVAASEWLTEALAKKGIKTTPEDLRALIEWGVLTMKSEAGKQWAEV